MGCCIAAGGRGAWRLALSAARTATSPRCATRRSWRTSNRQRPARARWTGRSHPIRPAAPGPRPGQRCAQAAAPPMTYERALRWRHVMPPCHAGFAALTCGDADSRPVMTIMTFPLPNFHARPTCSPVPVTRAPLVPAWLRTRLLLRPRSPPLPRTRPAPGPPGQPGQRSGTGLARPQAAAGLPTQA